MMNRQELAAVRQASLGDAAVDGLLAGVGAGLVMAAYLVLAGLLAGTNPLDVLARFSAGQNGSPLMGLLNHLAVASMYGVVFGLLAFALMRRQIHPERLWLAGALYGLALFLIAQFVIFPNTSTPFGETPVFHLAAAHLLYGLMAGVFLSRSLRR